VVDASDASGAAYAADDMVLCGWAEFVSARDRFFAQLAALPAPPAPPARERGLSAPRDEGYDRALAEHRQESRSR
jgi:hypothetical protein